MASTLSISLLSMPSGSSVAVTLAGQGDIKNIPISSLLRPVFFIASFAARLAAKSAGVIMGNSLSISSGKRTLIRRTIEGQAVEIYGLPSGWSAMYFLVSSDTISAAAATSKTSSKPRLIRAFKIMPVSVTLLNCA